MRPDGGGLQGTWAAVEDVGGRGSGVAAAAGQDRGRPVPRRTSRPRTDMAFCVVSLAPFFFALESGRPDFWKIRSTLFWALVLRIRA